MAKFVVTIDGPAGSGKSTVARLTAAKLGASFLDTGAMYRAVTLAAMQGGADLEDEEKLAGVVDSRKFEFATQPGHMGVSIDGEDKTEQIRKTIVTANSKHVASSAKVRARLVELQREVGENVEKLVTEGRDQGTVVFPDADVKVFLTASKMERARRRHAELAAKGNKDRLEQVLDDIIKRDEGDMAREVGPLQPADDAIVIDTTDMSVEEVVDKICDLVREKCGKI